MKTTPLILAGDVAGTRIKLGLVRGGRVLAHVEMDGEAGMLGVVSLFDEPK